MNLYKISQKVHRGWDTFSNAVVFAYTAEEARLMHPDKKRTAAWPVSEDQKNDPDFYDRPDWANDPSEVLAEYLGEAHPDFEDFVPGFEKGIICASFHAG